jgi:signal transduction histidine kinase/CheY-like chemotaxis protein
MKLAQRLGPALVAGVAGVVLVASLVYKSWHGHADAIRRAHAQTADFASALEEQTRQTLHRVGASLRRADEIVNALHAQGTVDDATLRRELAELLPPDRLIHSLVVLDRNGTVRLSTAVPSELGSSADSDYYTPHVRGADREFVFGAPVSATAGQWLLPVSRRITLADGTADGVLVAWVQPRYFQAFYDTLADANGGFVALFLTSGWAAVTSPSDGRAMARSWSDTPLFSRHMPAWPTGTAREVDAHDRVERITSYRVLNDYPVAVSYGLATASVLSGWHESLWRDALFLLLALTVLGGAAKVLIRHDRSRREAERAHEQMLAAQAANRAKTEFLARMSHELRTPLNAVLGFAQLLGNQAEPLAPGQQRNLKLLYDGALHLQALVNDVIDVASIEAGRLDIALRPVAVDEAIGSALSLCSAAAATAGVRLAAAGPPGDRAAWVSADATRLRQVLANLISNGIKYNRAGGRVTVSAEAAADRVRIEVADDGLGLTPAQQGQLFTPYNRLGREVGTIRGTGIGLVLARQLVELMGGTLTVRSEAEHGTVVTVDLPRAAPATEPTRSTVAGPWHGGGVVLYIEDEPVNQVLVQETLRACPDIELILADNGREGIALAHRHRPDLVLLDMRLPDMDGPQVLEALRRDPATRDIRVVVLSAGAMSDDIGRARAAGATDYWTKPFDIARLRADVQRMLSESESTA